MKIKGIYHIFTLLICSLFTTISFGQNASIQGKITDAQTNEGLMGAKVQLINTTKGAICDLDGNYVIANLEPGTYFVTVSLISYQTHNSDKITVKAGETITFDAVLNVDEVSIEEVEIVAKINRESEVGLLLEQKKSMLATQSIGASELSRKGIGDAESAVASVSGISKQEGVKNVFVRGLGDRYNSTLLNGLPVPSEDPEYKNIALALFETDIIKNIGVDKVFSSSSHSDVGGAIITIQSKELQDNYEFGVAVSTGINSRAIGTNFKKSDGFNYFGVSNISQPKNEEFNFNNKLDPQAVKFPMNESYRISGGKKFDFKKSSLSLFGVATHASDYSYTEEIVRNTTTDGTIYQDQIGKKYSGKKSQLALANINYTIANAHSISYNFMLLHATNHYVGEFLGKHAEKFQDGATDQGYLRRQQINDNLLLTNQLLTSWKLSEKWRINLDAAVNQIKGSEPDRRENYLSQKADGSYGLTGSNRQKRFYSRLEENDYNAKLEVRYQLNDKQKSNNSALSFGYNGRFSSNHFEATEYNFSAVSGKLTIDNLSLDNMYNAANFQEERFTMTQSFPSSYNVSRNNHSAFALASFQFSSKWSGALGFKYDFVNLSVLYDVPGQKGMDSIRQSFYLPSINLKYDITEKHSLRFGASKTYTLPQSKEISPYQYVNIGFTSEGNHNLRHSDNYNADLKWDYYLTPSEIITFGVFYKYIVNPIGRVDKGNSAGLLTYDNIGKAAQVFGAEFELRKTIFHLKNNDFTKENKLTIGTNVSYIFTSTTLNLTNTPERISQLEGASPLLINADLTYNFSKNGKGLTTSLVFNYFSDRIFTIGTMGYNDIIEKGVPTFDIVLAGKISKRIGLKLKASNVLDPNFRLTRKVAATGETVLLNQYKKGVNISLGLSFNL